MMMRDGDDPIDLEALRVAPGQWQPAIKPRPKKWRRQFVRVPWTWIEHLSKAKRTTTWRLAMVLLYEHWRTGGHPIALSNVGLESESLKRRSKWNALAELEKLGLIQVERRHRRSPRLRLLQVDQEPKS
jgi:hypothetical protein